MLCMKTRSQVTSEEESGREKWKILSEDPWNRVIGQPFPGNHPEVLLWGLSPPHETWHH